MALQQICGMRTMQREPVQRGQRPFRDWRQIDTHFPGDAPDDEQETDGQACGDPASRYGKGRWFLG